jgi:hypothetical protein
MSRGLGLDITLGELIAGEDTSVRLANCVERSALAELTVARALEMGPSLETFCQRVPAMGNKTIRELQGLLARFATRSEPIGAKMQASQGPTEERTVVEVTESHLLNRISAIYSVVSLTDTIENVGVSVRLRHAIERAPLKDRPLGQLLLQWAQTCTDLLEISHFGRTSLQELRGICTDLIRSHLAVSGLETHFSDTVCALLFDGKAISNEVRAQLAERLADLPVFTFDVLRSREVQSPEASAETLLTGLDERSRDILVRRYGLRGFPSETLEQIAERYSIVRERIRQLESAALKKLAVRGRKLPLRESLLAHGDDIWSEIVGESGFLKLEDTSNRLTIAPCIRLLMDVQGISIRELLNHIACRWQDGWLGLTTDTHALDQAKFELEKVLTGKSLPRPLPTLSSAKHSKITRIVAEAGLGVRTYRGYVLSKEMTPRSQTKLINLHTQMGNGRFPYDAAVLATMLGRDHKGRSTSARYVTIVMERHPHLFLEADDGQWFGIGGRGFGDVREVSSTLEAAPENDEVEDDTFTTAGLLREILMEEGPTRLSRLVEIASGRLPTDRSTASVGPTLISNPELFVRVLPGVYALKDQIPSSKVLVEQQPEYLLNEEQARYYALGRRAGEPWGTFPLWSPAAEFALCSWALDNAATTIFQSLVSVADFDAWPVDETTKHAWLDFAKQRSARFLLDFQPREGVGYVLPKLDRLLAACLEARSRGQFNWMVGNRILKRPVYSHKSAGLVALMCCLDAIYIDSGCHWQLPHSCGSNLDKLILLLTDELHNHGKLDWSSSLGARILLQAGDAIGRRLGWVDGQLLAAMLTTPLHSDGLQAAESSDFIEKIVETETRDLHWVSAEEAEKAPPHFEGNGLAGYSALQVASVRIFSKEEGEWSFDDGFTD